MNIASYGTGDASYRAAGGLTGIRQLVEEFYRVMNTHPQARHLRQMHQQTLAQAEQKLSYFLSGWLGGPKLYAQHYGSINIPHAHRHLAATEADGEAWLLCMRLALERQPFADDFKTYLLSQLAIPVARIVASDAG